MQTFDEPHYFTATGLELGEDSSSNRQESNTRGRQFYMPGIAIEQSRA
jgi:hypothetical protein